MIGFLEIPALRGSKNIHEMNSKALRIEIIDHLQADEFIWKIMLYDYCLFHFTDQDKVIILTDRKNIFSN